MFTRTKMWLYGLSTGLIALFFSVFIYRGKKIKNQYEIINKQKQEAKIAKQYQENKSKIQEFEKQNLVEAEKAKHVEKPINTPDGYYQL